MAKQWTAEDILQIGREYQRSCVLAAAADLDLFAALAGKEFSAEEAARKLQADARGMRVLLDALAALELLTKREERYEVPGSVAKLLGGREPGNVLAMTQHQANCMRRWDQLAWVVRSGRPVDRRPSIRGADADYAAFIEAMDNISAPVAERLVGEIKPPAFTQLLDVGGASGTWTIAFLRQHPRARATIFDLPQVIPQARQRIGDAGLGGRVELVGGDFAVDELPAGADLAWVSAIVHQNSRQQNRGLFAKVGRALRPGGHILIRDILMEPSRTTPAGGAMFAINMLTATEGGGRSRSMS